MSADEIVSTILVAPRRQDQSLNNIQRLRIRSAFLQLIRDKIGNRRAIGGGLHAKLYVAAQGENEYS